MIWQFEILKRGENTVRNPFSDSFTEDTIKSFLCEFDSF